MNVFRHVDRDRVLFDVAVNTAAPAYYDNEFQDLGGRIFHLPRPNRRTIFRYLGGLNRILRDEGPFVAVHSHIYHFSGLVVSLARLAGVPVRIAHSHNTNDGRATDVFRASYRLVMSALIRANAGYLIGCSKPACVSLFGERCREFRVFRNAIDPGGFRLPEAGTRNSVRASLGLGQGDFVIGHIGRFDPQKNHSGLIDIFAKVAALRSSARLLLVGDGSLRAEIEERCRLRGVEGSVLFLGIRSDVPHILAACDAFVLPSLCEGLAFVVVEAQTAGLPCVVSEAIPEEADLGLGLLKRLRLESGVETWAAELLGTEQRVRPSWEHRQERLLASGFDMHDAVHKWESLYLSKPA